MRTRAAQQLQQHGLGLVVGMMCERNDVDVLGEEALVACAAGERFEAAATLARDLHAMQSEAQSALRALRGAEFCPAGRVRRQAVVDVNGGERDGVPFGEPRHRIEQRHRIHAARERDGNARLRLDVLGQCRVDGCV